MGIEIFFGVVVVLLLFALFDLVVGVSNDAVNFLNSSIGSKVAPMHVILTVASLGILAGVTFSSGMMEVARKGIFHPEFFTMPELIIIFLSVMTTDILLLDMFNTYALPTSTTVSIVFELLGSAVAISIIKMHAAGENAMSLGEYINSGKALMIISGILISIIVAFISGMVVQFISRLIFTFDYKKTLKRYGAVWGGVAMAFITYFIIVKGAKGASFITENEVQWIMTHTELILLSIFVVSAFIFEVLILFFDTNIFKPIVLIGTFALAMAFAANDLVNFIGVPLAGLYAYKTAILTDHPLTATMGALSGKVHSQTFLLLIAGIVMALTLYFSRKARSVTETEISLGQQEEGTERFESIWLSRAIVSMVASAMNAIALLIPQSVRKFISGRIDPQNQNAAHVRSDHPYFDLVRASVNLMVASALISFATSLKLPLSTTYVTFMVAMGTSFSDQAWGRESAVYRVTGVLTVIGGWFMTAMIAFTTAFVFANIIYRFKIIGFTALMAFEIVMFIKNHQKHKDRVESKESLKIFNLTHVSNARAAISDTFEQLAHLIEKIRESFDVVFNALFNEDAQSLTIERKKAKQIQLGANIIMANIFKVLRLQQKKDAKISYKYAQTIRRLQKLSDGHRDTVMRSYKHIGNRHKGLLPVQVEELKEIKTCITDIFFNVETCLRNKEIINYQNIVEQYKHLREIADRINQNQIERIRNDECKTRLSILFYAIIGNCIMMGKQNIKLLEIFNESFKFDKELADSYIKLDS